MKLLKINKMKNHSLVSEKFETISKEKGFAVNIKKTFPEFEMTFSLKEQKEFLLKQSEEDLEKFLLTFGEKYATKPVEKEDLVKKLKRKSTPELQRALLGKRLTDFERAMIKRILEQRNGTVPTKSEEVVTEEVQEAPVQQKEETKKPVASVKAEKTPQPKKEKSEKEPEQKHSKFVEGVSIGTEVEIIPSKKRGDFEKSIKGVVKRFHLRGDGEFILIQTEEVGLISKSYNYFLKNGYQPKK